MYLATFAGDDYQYLGQFGGIGGVAENEPWGASTELARVVLPVVPEPIDPTPTGLAEWFDGTEIPVTVTNEGNPLPPVQAEENRWHAVSEDGSRVYFTASEGNVAQVYVRVNLGRPQSALGVHGECLEAAQACTIEVSASQRHPEDPSGPQSARYWGASADGAKVFFTSSAELTADAYTGTHDQAANLYEYDLATGELTDLTVDAGDVAEGAAVQGVVQISEDGSYVYFVADGKLAGGAVAGEPNLYVSHEGGAPVFIAALGAKDATDWLGPNVYIGERALRRTVRWWHPAARSWRSSPNGR